VSIAVVRPNIILAYSRLYERTNALKSRSISIRVLGQTDLRPTSMDTHGPAPYSSPIAEGPRQLSNGRPSDLRIDFNSIQINE